MNSIKSKFNISPNKVALNFFIFITILLSGCGGGGGSGSVTKSGLNIPIVTVSGIAFDGLISGGTVSIYDFTNGTKRNQLATTTTDGKGLYNLTIQIESSPVLIEVTGGNYIEEASSTQVALQPAHKLTALTYYTMGSPINAAITPYTHVAAGLAAYHIKQGTAITTAINEANKSLSNLTGFDIVATTPLQITDASNANAVLTPELKYGFLSGAISMWTKNHVPTNGTVHIYPATSIDFAQSMYQDIMADGFLDGMGLDNQSKTMPLLFGTTPLSADVYRRQLGISLLQISKHANNKTGITPTNVLPFAQTYTGNTNPVFNGVAVTQIVSTPIVSITSHTANQWVNKSINVVATVQDDIGLISSELIVDNTVVATLTGNNATPAFQLNTTSYSEGSHNISIRSVNAIGSSTTTNLPMKFDNIAPTSTSNIPVTSPPLSGCASDGGSGVLSVTNVGGIVVTPDAQTGCWSMTLPTSASKKFEFRDKVNNCSLYEIIVTGAFWDPNNLNNLIYEYGWAKSANPC